MEYEPITLSNLPLEDELVHVLVSLDSTEWRDLSVKSDFQWQLFKTRLIIYEDVNIIATPVLNMQKFINVICLKYYYLQGSLALLLNKHKLQVESVTVPPQDIYQDCLLYTMMCRLSPEWNRIENYLIKDKYFLFKRGQLVAVELRLKITGRILQIYCFPKRIWCVPMEIADLEIPQATMEQIQNKKFYIDYSGNSYWVHVLPSFKRGRIVYLTNEIPKDSVFKNYTELRRHWKNIYGFRLPHEDTSMIYAGVNFFGPQNYTYPLVCIRKGMHYNVGDPDYIQDFFKHFMATMPHVCGVRFVLTNFPEFPYNSNYKFKQNSKWNEKNLLQIERRLVHNFMNPHSEGEGCNNLITPKDEEWFAKCSSFIDGLSDLQSNKKYEERKRPIFIKKPLRMLCGPVTRQPIFIEEPNKVKAIEGRHEIPNIFLGNGLPESSNVQTGHERTTLPLKPVFLKPKSIPKDKKSQQRPLTSIQIPKPMKSLYKNKSDAKSETSSCSNNIMENNIEGIPFIDKTTNELNTPKNLKKSWKPTMLTDSEIESLAKCGRLDKVNASCLYKFLKNNGVKCTKKDKKNELLMKAEWVFKNRSHSN